MIVGMFALTVLCRVLSSMLALFMLFVEFLVGLFGLVSGIVLLGVWGAEFISLLEWKLLCALVCLAFAVLQK